MQVCYLLLPAAGMMPMQTAKDILTALSPGLLQMKYGCSKDSAPQEQDLLWGHQSQLRFAELASEEDFGWRPAEFTGDRLKGNYSKLLQRERTTLSIH